MPARITRVDKHHYLAATPDGETDASVSGRFRNTAGGQRDYPAVGDWVALDLEARPGKALIQKVLPRANAFVRKAPISGGRGLTTVGGREQIGGGTTEQQVVAANIDTLLCVSALDQDFSLNRIERYLLLGLSSGAAPAIVLNKADSGEDVESRVAAVRAMAGEIPIHAISALTGAGVEQLDPYLATGRTVALVGSSGVGKSTLVNRLLGTARLAVGPVRALDGKGRHTTSRRELLLAPQGGVLIDTPGMREVQLWVDEAAVRALFADVEALMLRCRFPDCRHSGEPGCAIAAALQGGSLDRERYTHFLRLLSEVSYLDTRKRAQPRRGRSRRPEPEDDE